MSNSNSVLLTSLFNSISTSSNTLSGQSVTTNFSANISTNTLPSVTTVLFNSTTVNRLNSTSTTNWINYALNINLTTFNLISSNTYFMTTNSPLINNLTVTPNLATNNSANFTLNLQINSTTSNPFLNASSLVSLVALNSTLAVMANSTITNIFTNITNSTVFNNTIYNQTSTACPLQTDPTIQTSIWCEPSLMSLQCSSPNVIQIVCAYYGIDSSYKCPGGFYYGAPASCYFLSAGQKVFSQCNDKTSCTILGNPNFQVSGFEDPCYGFSKILYVQYRCIISSVLTITTNSPLINNLTVTPNLATNNSANFTLNLQINSTTSNPFLNASSLVSLVALNSTLAVMANSTITNIFTNITNSTVFNNTIYNQTLQTNASSTMQPTTISNPIIECYSILASNRYFSYNYTTGTVCVNTNHCTYKIEVLLYFFL